MCCDHPAQPALLASGGSTPRLSETPTDSVELAGRWELDRGASDDPLDLISTAMVVTEVERAGGARRPSGDGGGNGSGGGGAGPGGMSTMDPTSMVPNPDWLDITQCGQRFGRYPLDTPITTVNRAGTLETRSGWSATDFWTVTKSERGLTLTERYVVSPDGSELVLETVLDSKRFDDPLTIRRVFLPGNLACGRAPVVASDFGKFYRRNSKPLKRS